MRINRLSLAWLMASVCLPAMGNAAELPDQTMSHHDHGEADPLLAKVMVDQLEAGEGSDNLDAQAWVGKDLHKLWLKAELERGDQGTESAEVQALYSQAVSPFWDLQIGLRRDDRPTPARDWLVVGAQGLAPYFFEFEGAVFVGERGRSAARVKVEYDLLFTQRLILSPSMEANAYGQNDPASGKGAGLADSRAGLRLRYEVYREFAPYLGVEWRRDYGTTADLTRAAGQAASEHQWVLGLRTWF